MPSFEFVLKGPPVSLNAMFQSKASRKRYRNWVHQVNATARASWPADVKPVRSNSVTVTLTCYHTEAPPDVDNILKPICDGMKGVVYEDDKQVWKVTGQRLDLATTVVDDASDILIGVLGQWEEIVHIAAVWDEGDRP